MTNPASGDGGRILESTSIERGMKVLPLIQSMEFTEKKVNFLKGLPPMIMQNGLGQTIAFMQSKKGSYLDIVEIFNILFECNIMEEILNYSTDKYVARQKEAIEYAGWMKNFALAFYIKPASCEDNNDDTSTK